MRIALDNENLGKVKILSGLLDRCTRENLRFAEVVSYVRQEDFCRMVRDGPEDFDLFVVAQDGTYKRLVSKNREYTFSQK